VSAASDLSQAAASVPPKLEPIAQWVVFCMDAGRYAVPLSAVERVVRAVQVTPLPQAPAAVLGVIDVSGRVLPVFNIRQRFGLPERGIILTDEFLIAHTSERTVVLAVDAVLGVLDRSAAAVINIGNLAPGLVHIHGVIQTSDGLVLINDLEAFLSTDEALALDVALNQAGQHAG
jgi:purine-binding chemotaxis protein CheW